MVNLAVVKYPIVNVLLFLHKIFLFRPICSFIKLSSGNPTSAPTCANRTLKFRFFILLVILLITAVLLVSSKKKKRTHQIPLANREARNSQEFDVHGNFRKEFGLSCAMADPKRSVICSPISALLPLGKLVLGADGKSEKELLKTIGLSSASEVEKHFKKLISTLGALHGVRLDIASQIYMNKDSKLHSNYKKKVKSIFGSTIETVDMDDADGVSSKINSWVSHQTHQKINDLLKPGDIVPGTMTILVNAIYFSGKWKHPFKIVRDDIFYGAKGNITIPMMTIEEHYHYGVSKALNSEIIKIPYSKEEAFFYICLPEKEGGVELLLEQLKLVPDLLNSAQLVKQKVKLTMPKFKIETEFDLGRLYQDLGLKSMFESYHGLKNMVKGKSIVVNKAIHKAMIEVTEEGTIAAAASVITGLGAAMYVPEIIKFKANRPFLYFIVAQKQQLFAGLFTGN